MISYQSSPLSLAAIIAGTINRRERILKINPRADIIVPAIANPFPVPVVFDLDIPIILRIKVLRIIYF